MANKGKPTKKEMKRHTPAKTSFTSPFCPAWSPLPQEDMHFILKTLKDKLLSIGLEKKEVKVFRPWKKKNKSKNPDTPVEPATQVSPDAQVKDSATNGWTDVTARKRLAIGINEVTKALERNELTLLLVCKSVKPQHMTDHLVALSASRGVLACQVPRLSQSVSEALGLKSVLALGFRKPPCRDDDDDDDDDVFTDAVNAISSRVPTLDVQWLQSGAPSEQADDSVSLADEMEEEEEEEDAMQRKGQKRKLESDSDVTQSPSSCVLQPLKVKRIVANPAKKRKTKGK